MDAKITLKLHIKSHIKTTRTCFGTKEPSSGGEHLCLAKGTCGSTVLVHVKSVSIVAAYISCKGKSVYLDTYVKNRNMCTLSGSFHILFVADLPVVCVRVAVQEETVL